MLVFVVASEFWLGSEMVIPENVFIGILPDDME